MNEVFVAVGAAAVAVVVIGVWHWRRGLVSPSASGSASHMEPSSVGGDRLEIELERQAVQFPHEIWHPREAHRLFFRLFR